jgi:hypothetical protein
MAERMTDERFEGLVTQIYGLGVTWMDAQLIDEARRARRQEAAYREALETIVRQGCTCSAFMMRGHVERCPVASAHRVLDEKGEG